MASYPTPQTGNQELDQLMKRHRAELRELRGGAMQALKEAREETMQALKEGDETTKLELQERAKRLHDQIEKVKKDSEEAERKWAEADRARLDLEIKEPQDRVVASATISGTDEPAHSPSRRIPSHPTPSLGQRYNSSSPPLRGEASVDGQRSIPLPHIMIAVIGATGSGKTSFVNLASGSNLRVGNNLKSCTTDIQLADEFTLDGQRVILIDTPGFDDTLKSDTDVLKMIAAFLNTTYEGGTKLSGVIYIQRISNRRSAGISRQNFRMFRQLCGETTLKTVIIVTNMWGEAQCDIAEGFEKELSSKIFRPVLDMGAQMVRHHDTVQSAHDIIRRIAVNRPVPLQIQEELVDETKDIFDTDAGQAVNQELHHLLRRHQAELKEVRTETMEALWYARP